MLLGDGRIFAAKNVIWQSFKPVYIMKLFIIYEEDVL